MAPMSPEQTRSRASIAASMRWAKTRDREAATRAARAARWQKYLNRARELQGPDATYEQVDRAAEHLFKADMARMSLKAANARRAKAQARKAAS